MTEIIDNERTIIYGENKKNLMSPEELRIALGLHDGENIQDYENIRTIGIGGVGAVLSAYEPGLNREIAIKLLRPQFRDNAKHIETFIREARATAQIDHPNIVPVHRIGVFKDAGVYFTMKKVDGETLRGILKKLRDGQADSRRKYRLNRLLEIYVSVCNAVAFAHSHGILHCDLKPSNIMIGNYGEVLVMDWGMAQYRVEMDKGVQDGNKMELDLNCQLDKERTVREPLTFGGTPAFMAPEDLLQKNAGPTQYSDIYSLGAILYTILCWDISPFDASATIDQIAGQAIAGKIVPLRKRVPKEQPLPLELEAICKKAMHLDSKQRYASVDDLVQDIRNYLDQYPVSAYSPPPFYRLNKLILRHPLIPVTIIAAILTWLGFYGFVQLNNISHANTIMSQAEYSYAQASELYFQAVRSLRLLKTDDGAEINSDAENNFYRLLKEYENNCNLTMELLGRAADYNRQHTDIDRMVRDIFKNLNYLYLSSNNFERLEQFLTKARSRWGELSQTAIANDYELRAINRRLNRNLGKLKLQLPDNQLWQCMLIEPDRRERAVTQSGDMDLAPGKYLVKLTNQSSRKELFIPLKINSIGESSLNLDNLPSEIPDDMAYIPAGPRIDGTHQDKYYVSVSNVPAFLIKLDLVSLSEYLEFWQTLAPEQKTRFTALDIDKTPLWNRDGKLKDGLVPEAPVTGLAPEAIIGYCNFIGKKLNAAVRLPYLYEWEKANNLINMDKPENDGADNDNHLRELVLPSVTSSDEYIIIGNLAGQNISSFNTYFLSSHAKKVGFRYVVDLKP